MSVPGCLIVQRSRGWLVVVGTETQQLAADADPVELALCAEQLVKQAGIKNPVCILAPDSDSCFFATLSPSDDVDLRDRSALTFELEDHLPIDAESMVADFAVVPANDSTKTVSAIAIELDRWRCLTDAIEAAGLNVRSIVPRVVLAATALAEVSGLDDNVELLLVDGGHCDSVTLIKRTIRSWKHLVINAQSLRRHRLLDAVDAANVVVAAQIRSSSRSSTRPIRNRGLSTKLPMSWSSRARRCYWARGRVARSTCVAERWDRVIRCGQSANKSAGWGSPSHCCCSLCRSAAGGARIVSSNELPACDPSKNRCFVNRFPIQRFLPHCCDECGANT